MCCMFCQFAISIKQSKAGRGTVDGYSGKCLLFTKAIASAIYSECSVWLVYSASYCKCLQHTSIQYACMYRYTTHVCVCVFLIRICISHIVPEMIREHTTMYYTAIVQV